MKKYYFMAALLLTGFAFTACSDDDDDTTSSSMPEGTADVTVEIDDVDPDDSNIDNWTTYCQIVAQLLVSDATSLYSSWNESYNGGSSYADQFKNKHTSYTSYAGCVEEIIDGCIDIASEVGASKIGEPRDLWESGQYENAVLAVESWYSWHSITDYSNNILSIRNAIYGTRDGSISDNSIATYLSENNSSLYNTVVNAIDEAYSAIQGMAAPFRSHIGNSTVLVAIDACSDLEKVLDNQLKSYIISVDESDLQPIIEQYVDAVVLPTYSDLVEKNQDLYTAVAALRQNPGTTTFYACAQAWLEAREPWETSEAFLFGPVANLGLDPNMDSWPLDLDAIQSILKDGDWSELNWDGDYDEDSEDIEAAQNVRGYHTLEFLIFKNGQARTY